MSLFRVAVIVDLADLSPHELRKAFAQSLVNAILKAHLDGRIETPKAEEILRVIPAQERF
jgi:hypothetical protein